MCIGKMSSFNVLLTLVISAITQAYPAQNQFMEYIRSSDPFPNYQVLVNRPYPAPYAFTSDESEAGPSANYNDLTPFEQVSPPVPQRSKSPTPKYQKEEVKDVLEDVLRLLIDQRLCEITNENDSPIAKRSVNQHFAARAAATPETNSFSPQQLAFLKDLKPEQINQLINLLVPATSTLATNKTLPVQQELSHVLPSTFYVPPPVWHHVPLQGQVFPSSPYIQNHLVPVHPFEHQQIISYEPFKPAEQFQFQIINPYVESPVAPPMVLNRMPPIQSPFVYSLQISAPMATNQAAARPLTAGPNSPIVPKPLPAKPPMGVTSSPQTSSVAEKLASIFSQSRLILDGETTTKGPVTSTEKSQVVLGALPSNTVDAVSKGTVELQNSSKLKQNAGKSTAKSAAEESSVSEAVQLDDSVLLAAFKAIREDLRKNNVCKLTTPKRRDINERPNADLVRNEVNRNYYPNYLSKHAIPPAYYPGRHHDRPVRVLYHKYTPHTPFRTPTS